MVVIGHHEKALVDERLQFHSRFVGERDEHVVCLVADLHLDRVRCIRVVVHVPRVGLEPTATRSLVEPVFHLRHRGADTTARVQRVWWKVKESNPQAFTPGTVFKTGCHHWRYLPWPPALAVTLGLAAWAPTCWQPFPCGYHMWWRALESNQDP